MSRFGLAKVAGLTMVELLISLALGIVMLWGGIQIFAAGQQSYQDAQRFNTLQAELGFVSDSLLTDVRGASEISLNPAANVLTLTTGGVQLQYARTADNELQRTVDAESAQALAATVSALQFACLDAAFSAVDCGGAIVLQVDISLSQGNADDVLTQQFRLHIALRNAVMTAKFGGGL